ncbi:hypothetical protein N2152v2_002911 [Parachlorella kessleri]
MASRRNALAPQSIWARYGDIGTSPLYTFASVFPDGAPEDSKRVLGAFSMIFWTLTALVLVKYVFIVLAADDHGEGGTFALYSLLCRAARLRAAHQPTVSASDGKAAAAQSGAPAQQRRNRTAAWVRGALESHPGLQLALLLVVLLAACLVMSDGVLTPAISVISAIEGIQFNTGISRGAVVGITCGILAVLFLLQSFGTARVSFIFSPFILLWLVANAAIGVYNIAKYNPGCFKGLSPHYIYYYWQGEAHEGWLNLGHIMLAITGTEALFADIGHFNANAVRLGFTFVAFPCLTLTYLGQAAMIIERPESSAAAYWESLPHPIKWPMVVLATAATIIASQALISGAFSITQQAVSLSCFPRVTIRHTSEHVKGQVYIPEVNYLLMTGTIAVVLIFQTSSKIGNAYGLAVITVMLMTTSLISLVMIICWEVHLLLVATFWLVFTFIEAAFWSSNIVKVPEGAWFTLALSLILTALCSTWVWGQSLKLGYVQANAVPLRSLLQASPARGRQHAKETLTDDEDYEGDAPQALAPRSKGQPGLRLGQGGPLVARLPGVGIYYTELLQDVNPFLVHFLTRMPSLHEVVVLLTVRSVPIPHVVPDQQLLIRKLHLPGFFRVVVRYGYMDKPTHDVGFVDTIIDEISEYLSPGMGFDQRPSSTSSEISPGLTVWVPGMDPPAYPTSGTPQSSLTVSAGARAAAALQDVLKEGQGSPGLGQLRRGLAGGMGPTRSRALVAVGNAGQGDSQDEAASFPWVQQPSSFRRALSACEQDSIHGAKSLPPGLRVHFAGQHGSTAGPAGDPSMLSKALTMPAVRPPQPRPTVAAIFYAPPPLPRSETSATSVSVAPVTSTSFFSWSGTRGGTSGGTAAPAELLPPTSSRAALDDPGTVSSRPQLRPLRVQGSSSSRAEAVGRASESPTKALSQVQRRELGSSLAATLAIERAHTASAEAAAAAAAGSAAAEEQEGEEGDARVGNTGVAGKTMRRRIFRLDSEAPDAAAAAAGVSGVGVAVSGRHAQQQQATEGVGGGGAMAAGAQTHGSMLLAEREFVRGAYRSGGASYVIGRPKLQAANKKAWHKRVVLEVVYAMLVNNSRSAPDTYQIPTSRTVELGVTYEV